jgi:hypothetical protein
MQERSTGHHHTYAASWSGLNQIHLRHSKFAGLREDKDARSVVKESG